MLNQKLFCLSIYNDLFLFVSKTYDMKVCTR
jgi:hypothetical protein